jgi:hypothetical protein
VAEARTARQLNEPIHWQRYRWEAWRPEEAARRLTTVQAPWCVAAGWAVDLFLGGERREHEDLEIAVPRDRFGEVAEALDEYAFYVPLGDGSERLRPLEGGGELPDPHQTWALDEEAGAWRLDVFREPSADGLWVCRRDEELRLPYDEVIAHTRDGIPYARPEIVLLFKAKHADRGPKDQADFDAVVPRLEPERRRWLADRLARIHPGHRWLALLESRP